MTNKTTSAIDLVERLRNYAHVASMLGHKLDDPNNVVVLATEAADTITRLQAALEWRPIETAPIGEIVLAWCPKHRLVLLERHADGRTTETWAISPSGRMDCPEPTHWMPLPEAPDRSSVGGE